MARGGNTQGQVTDDFAMIFRVIGQATNRHVAVADSLYFICLEDGLDSKKKGGEYPEEDDKTIKSGEEVVQQVDDVFWSTERDNLLEGRHVGEHNGGFFILSWKGGLNPHVTRLTHWHRQTAPI